MPRGKPWSRNELIIAMNLYCKLPFGQLDQKTLIIIEVAQRLERTPSSLAMKLVNLASLDPVLQVRGIQGLRGASKADREIWQEFNTNWEQLGEESEACLQELFETSIQEESQTSAKRQASKLQPTGSTEVEVTVKARLKQNFFRQTVLTNYNSRCCITDNPIPELLVASHILPWSDYPEHRLNPHNGLCLARTHDAAFDKGLITFDENHRLIISAYLTSFLPDKTLERDFVAYRGQPMRSPDKFRLIPDFLQIHREEIFRG